MDSLHPLRVLCRKSAGTETNRKVTEWVSQVPEFPPTVVVVHPRERRAKCTVRPLRGRPDFAFCNFPRMPYDISGYVRLGLGGPLLSPADCASGLLVLDGTWRHVEPMERAHAALPVRSLPPLLTAYPRSSKVRVDPDAGLATIEAIYAAYRLLGRDPAGLLDHYHWAREFVAQNEPYWPPSAHQSTQTISQ